MMRFNSGTCVCSCFFLSSSISSLIAFVCRDVGGREAHAVSISIAAVVAAMIFSFLTPSLPSRQFIIVNIAVAPFTSHHTQQSVILLQHVQQSGSALVVFQQSSGLRPPSQPDPGCFPDTRYPGDGRSGRSVSSRSPSKNPPARSNAGIPARFFPTRSSPARSDLFRFLNLPGFSLPLLSLRPFPSALK